MTCHLYCNRELYLQTGYDVSRLRCLPIGSRKMRMASQMDLVPQESATGNILSAANARAINVSGRVRIGPVITAAVLLRTPFPDARVVPVQQSFALVLASANA